MLREVQAPYLVGAEAEIGREPLIVRRNSEDVAVLVPIAGGRVLETLVTGRDGNVLGAVVSADEYDAFRAWKEKQISAPAKVVEPPRPGTVPPPITDDPEFERNRAAFHRLLPELLKEHRGRWVAIVDEKVVTVGSTSSAVLDEVFERLGDVRLYVQEVLEKPRAYRIN